MMDDKKLISEYKKMQENAAPDLWDRIESELKPVSRTDPPEVEPDGAGDGTDDINEIRKKARRKRFRTEYKAAAAVIILFGVSVGMLALPGGNRKSGQVMNAETTYAEEQYEAAEDIGAIHAETQDPMHLYAAGEETTAAGAASEALEGADTAAGPEHNTQVAAGESRPSGEGMISLSARSLAVPEDAVTIPADSQYFSEGILRETDLLCGAEVAAVSFAYDDFGKAVNVVYDIVISEILYAEDYVTAETMTVSSPIIKTEGDEAYVLYQMQVGETYLLPLRSADGGYELLYPFAPQIQVLGKQDYLFHSGYASLINDHTTVAEGQKEGDNDFYYDRMLIREDDAFLSDLISLVE